MKDNKTKRVSVRFTPEQYDIQVGSPASVTVYATKDIEDTVTTQALRNLVSNVPRFNQRENESIRMPCHGRSRELQLADLRCNSCIILFVDLPSSSFK